MPTVLEQPQNPPTASLPRTRERGHLLLVDWEGVAPSSCVSPSIFVMSHLLLVDWEGVAPVPPASPRPAAKAAVRANPLRRTWVDRAFSRGFLVLLALTALGVLASLGQH